jgi:SAM-dependent methyltransferase
MSDRLPPRDVAEYYDKYWSPEGYAPERPLAEPVRALLGRWVRPGDDCIDVGCGSGEGAGEWLSAHTNSYLGVDVSKQAVEAAQRRGLNAREVPDGSDLGCPPDSFDLAVSFEVLEHLFSPQSVAAEVLRVLRPRGRFLVTVPNIAHWRRRADLAFLGRWNPVGDDQSATRPWRDPHIRFFGMGSLRSMLEEAGFVDVSVSGLGGAFLTDLPPLRRFVRQDAPGPLHSRLVNARPALFARNVVAVAIKPEND